MNSRPAWSKEKLSGQPGLHRETLSQKTKPNQPNNQTNKKQNKTKKNPKYITSQLCKI
jgi:hypothetical protein